MERRAHDDEKTTRPFFQLCKFAGVGLFSATLFGFLGRVFWAFDLFSHFRVQIFQLCLVLIGIALWRRKNKQAAFLTLLACLNYAVVLPFYLGKPGPVN